MANNSPLMIDIGQGLSLMIGLPRLATWKENSRPKKPRRGAIGFNTETSHIEYFDGSNWFAAPMSKS